MSSQPTTALDNVCVPISVDAFCLTPDCCEGSDRDHPARIAPITQPNYTGLRFDSQIIQHDVLDPVDLHRTKPASLNPRVTDLGSPTHALRKNRIGVYLHWSLPRAYRSGASNASGAKAADGTDLKPPASDPNSGGDPSNKNVDPSNPVFRQLPNRWLVVRSLKHDLCEPVGKVSDIEGWIVESDRVWKIDQLDGSVDLEIDVAPFVQSGEADERHTVNKQAEVFLGQKSKAVGWVEPGADNQHIPLTAMSSSNPLFVDYTPHNGNVFSICDNFAYSEGGKTMYLTKASASYCVIGWHSEGKNDPFVARNKSLKDRLPDLLMQMVETTDNSAKLASEVDTRLLCHGFVTESDMVGLVRLILA